MSKKLPLTLACGDYEIVRALKEGTVEPDGIELTILTDMDSTTRHWRFIRNRDFDVAEYSCSSYVVARDQNLPVTAIPVFLHRRFRHGFVYINTGKGITKPTDLIGRKIGVKSYLTTACHWLRGILEHEYGVPHKSIEWFAELDEEVEFTPPADLKLTKLPNDKSVEDMLVEGELDAVLHADLIEPIVNKDPRVGRLWPDFKSEETGLLQEDRHLSDHARARHQAGDRRPASLGADQSVPCLRKVQGDRPCAGSTTRASCRSPGTARPGRSRKRSSAPTRGSMGSPTATGIRWKRWPPIRTNRG